MCICVLSRKQETYVHLCVEQKARDLCVSAEQKARDLCVHLCFEQKARDLRVCVF